MQSKIIQRPEHTRVLQCHLRLCIALPTYPAAVEAADNCEEESWPRCYVRNCLVVSQCFWSNNECLTDESCKAYVRLP